MSMLLCSRPKKRCCTGCVRHWSSTARSLRPLSERAARLVVASRGKLSALTSRRFPPSLPFDFGEIAMCRNIKTLFNFEPPATEQEVRDASLQFVRKLSGFNKPSKANQEAFELAVEQVAQVAMTLIQSLVTTAEPRDREIEAQRAKERA